MNNNEQLTQIDGYLNDLKEFKQLSYDEITGSQEFKDLILYHISYFFIDSSNLCNVSCDFYYERAFYFTNLYCRKPYITEKIQEAKEIMLKNPESLPVSLKEIENNFEIALNLYKKSEHLNTYLILNTANIVNWLKWLFKNMNKEIVPIYWLLYVKMVKIPKQLYVDQFTAFEELRNKMGNSELFILSPEELKKLTESAIRVLKELKKEIQKENIKQEEPRINKISGVQEQKELKENDNLKVSFDDIEKTFIKPLLQGKTNLEILDTVNKKGYKCKLSNVKNVLSKIYIKIGAFDESGRGSRHKAIKILSPRFNSLN